MNEVCALLAKRWMGKLFNSQSESDTENEVRDEIYYLFPW
jgi:hypothetical protein